MFVPRNIDQKFSKLKTVSNIIAIVGARQSGKTTFLKEEGKKFDYSYVLFDDPDARKLFDDDIKKFEIQYVKKYSVTILDEVQYCKDAGIKLKYLCEKGRKLWLTSSSEILLGKEILSYLVGRVSILRMYPFSLDEFIRAKKQKEFTEIMKNRLIWEHSLFGGYPKVVLTEDIETKKILLKDLYETMILKDIARTFSIEDTQSLERFCKYLSNNIGNLVSYENITNTLNMSFQTMKKYLDAMEKSYMVIKISPFYRNKNKEISKQPKIYFLDNGLRNAITNNFPLELDGKLFKNYVLSEIIKAGFFPKYWRSKNKAEVDFIIEKNKELIPIEIKLSLRDTSLEKSFYSFIQIYKPKTGIVVNYSGINKKININSCQVFFTDVFNLLNILRDLTK